MRYICIPEPVTVVDLFTDEPVSETPVSFAKTAKAMCAVLVQKRTLDLLDIIDLRAKLVRPAGEWVELADAEWKALETESKRPEGIFSPAALLCMGAHFRAILDASDKKPAVLAEKDNGASVAAVA